MFKHINKIIRAYIYWDIVINSAWGFIAPIFAIFLLQSIASGNVAAGVRIAGFATLFYWITKAILQLPIGILLDKTDGERDDFWFFLVGTIVTGLIPFGYLFSMAAWHIYVLEIIHAIAMSMVVPGANAIFIRHIDKGKEAYESGLDNTLAGVGVGITGAIGGLIAGYFGFKLIFILAGAGNLLAAMFVFSIKDHLKSKSQLKEPSTVSAPSQLINEPTHHNEF